MGQIFTPDKISELNITGAKTASLPSSTMTIGGQQYRNASALSVDLSTTGEGALDTGTIAASTTYYIYSVLGGSGSPVLVASIDPDTTGPTGYTAWKIVGAIETDATPDLDFVYDTIQGPGDPFSFANATDTKYGLALRQPLGNRFTLSVSKQQPADGGSHKIEFDTGVGSLPLTISGTGDVTIPETGLYSITSRIQDASTPNYDDIRIVLDNITTLVLTTQNEGNFIFINATLYLSAGDVISIYAKNSGGGGNITTTASDTASFFIINRVNY